MLSKSVKELPYVGEAYANKLAKLGISTVWHLLHHAPSRYLDFRNTITISQARPGETVTVKGKILSCKNQYTKRGLNMQLVDITDGTGNLAIVFFNQYYLLRTFQEGGDFSFAGTLSWWGRKLAMISPEYEQVAMGVHTGRLLPIYPETAGISSKWLRKRIAETLSAQAFPDFLPAKVLRKYSLLGLNEAFEKVHKPQSLAAANKGKARLAFNEVLFLHLQNLGRKKDWMENSSPNQIAIDPGSIHQFIGTLPFKLTPAQSRVVADICRDLTKGVPMNRLLEGDVGSGKTVVAAIAAYGVFLAGRKTIIMAPTQILANQHASTLAKLFRGTGIKVALITAGVKKKGVKADVYVGTHALIHRQVNFNNVALVVIDEQHKFGVEQRTHLVAKSGRKGIAPHVLTMTATPIPRSVALTLYGDMDLSTLDELPKGRVQVTTWIVHPEKRAGAYKWIREKISKDHSQVFVVCPLIEESDAGTLKEVKSAKEEYAHLKGVFPGARLGLLHGKLSVQDKNKAITAFRNGKTDILVATPVIEVGIDVPSATIMVVEAAERFGLATLHQLRGRVGRSDITSYCLLMTEGREGKALSRLEALTQTKTGFELAELDLKMRGPGEIFGSAQHGFPELKIANWADVDLIKSTKQVALQLPDLLAVVEDLKVIR